ncbi:MULTISPECIES: hypothetical protein [Halomonadaceae]|uniref:hypothetical protein n=1 Tax=Halomonadaceae TaxID=28256 RepID=UPI001581815E|nr:MULTISPECIES: hypothetical protein [Halomonas]MDI4637906.1 hypothetical protein [Halomonas sp. BMC7]NUJ58927.1 hypothetical protein [Halomonas taeanensis]
MAIDENGVHSAVRLNIGDITQVPKHKFPEEPKIGISYRMIKDFDGWTVAPNDGAYTMPCVIRVEEIDGDIINCVVTELHRDKI